MKKLLCTLLFFITIICNAQVSGSFNVGGDIDKFYPVSFHDGGWTDNAPTNLILGRSNVHTDSAWRGSLMATFNFHVSYWGHGSNFIDADIKPLLVGGYSFVAGWQDITPVGYGQEIIIWLRGGGITYNYKSNYAVNPVVYDGIQNALPFQISNGGQLSFKTTIEDYASTTGKYEARNAYFASNVGIGTTNPTSKLTVAGNIASREVKVTVDAGADFVFEKDYQLPSLDSVNKFIKENKHLPEIASAKEMQTNGINLSEMNIKLLQKIEEQTLYIIEMSKQLQVVKEQIQQLKKNLSK